MSCCDIRALLSYALNENWKVAKMKKTKGWSCHGVLWNGHKGWYMLGGETQGIITPVCFWLSGVNKILIFK